MDNELTKKLLETTAVSKEYFDLFDNSHKFEYNKERFEQALKDINESLIKTKFKPIVDFLSRQFICKERCELLRRSGNIRRYKKFAKKSSDIRLRSEVKTIVKLLKQLHKVKGIERSSCKKALKRMFNV